VWLLSRSNMDDPMASPRDPTMVFVIQQGLDDISVSVCK